MIKNESTANKVCEYMVLNNKKLLWLSGLLDTTVTDCKTKINLNCWQLEDIKKLIDRGVL